MYAPPEEECVETDMYSPPKEQCVETCIQMNIKKN
jgi:hypothetical protein